MAKRKKRATGSRRKKSPPLPGWVWMLFGLAVGLSVAAAIYVNDRRDRPTAEVAAPAASKPAAAPSASAKPQKKAATDKRFEFYDMLPKFEVVIPEEDIEVKPDVSAVPVAAPGLYVLQAGSFSSNDDADRMKAQLALLGIVSRIQKVTVDDKAYHRVRVGPVNSLNELNAMRTQLRRAQIDVMVIRVGE